MNLNASLARSNQKIVISSNMVGEQGELHLDLPEVPQTEETQQVSPQPLETTAEPKMRTVESSIDFDLLHQTNKDIYAWIYVPDTVIDYPVLQSASVEEDSFYLNHGTDRSYYAAGSIYTEKKYNSLTFDDPMTILYGHNMRNGSMFAKLNEYADKECFDEHPDFYIYTEEFVHHYNVYTAFPYSNKHIHVFHDFSNEQSFNQFFSDIDENYKENRNVREECRPVFGDKLVVLSTCYKQDHSHRFIVIGVLDETMRVVDKSDAQ